MTPIERLSVAIALGSALAGCGDSSKASVGPVDVAQAPAELALSCDHDVGPIAFDNPCLVGESLGGGNEAALGVHEVECALATSGHPVTWAFLLSLAEVTAKPVLPRNGSFPAAAS